jgi:hypothetical protein
MRNPHALAFRFPDLLTFKLGPLKRDEIKSVGITCDYILPCVTRGTSEEHYLGL